MRSGTGKRKYAPEEIVRKLMETEVLSGQAATIWDVRRRIEAAEQTCHRWSKEFGGARTARAVAVD